MESNLESLINFIIIFSLQIFSLSFLLQQNKFNTSFFLQLPSRNSYNIVRQKKQEGHEIL